MTVGIGHWLFARIVAIHNGDLDRTIDDFLNLSSSTEKRGGVSHGSQNLLIETLQSRGGDGGSGGLCRYTDD